MEKWNLEQRWAIKFCVKLNDNATETYEKWRRAYGEHALLRTQVFRWHKAFLDGRESVEDEPRCGRPCTLKADENVTKVRDLGRSDLCLTERSVVCWIWIAKPSTTQKKFSSCPATVCEHLDADSRQCSLSHCHLRERSFGRKRYFSGSAANILAWTESVWLLPFPKTQIPPQRSSFWNCGQHTQVRDRPAEGTSMWRLPALLPGGGATSPAVCGFPRKLLWRG